MHRTRSRGFSITPRRGEVIMSLIFSSEEGWLVSHLQYLNDIYRSVSKGDSCFRLTFNALFFDINSQYLRQNQVLSSLQSDNEKAQSKTRKRKRLKLLPQDDLNELDHLKQAFDALISYGRDKGFFCGDTKSDNNESARLMAQQFYLDTYQDARENLHGCNDTDAAIVSKAMDKEYVFPKRCTFYCYDVREITDKLELNNQYDFILLDPPWWNKSIRRKKGKYVEASYKMMYNEELVKIPIGQLLSSNGIVAIWCTNAPSHLHSIFNEMFPSWGVTYKAKWYWIKVTQNGDTICNFNTGPGKQPYELLILGTAFKDTQVNIPEGKLLVSVPSAVHSHKPPLTEVIKKFLPREPKCLELFARYLLPGWTSWGLEVLKFQHLSLYKVEEIKCGANNIS